MSTKTLSFKPKNKRGKAKKISALLLSATSLAMAGSLIVTGDVFAGQKNKKLGKSLSVGANTEAGDMWSTIQKKCASTLKGRLPIPTNWGHRKNKSSEWSTADLTEAGGITNPADSLEYKQAEEIADEDDGNTADIENDDDTSDDYKESTKIDESRISKFEVLYGKVDKTPKSDTEPAKEKILIKTESEPYKKGEKLYRYTPKKRKNKVPNPDGEKRLMRRASVSGSETSDSEPESYNSDLELVDIPEGEVQYYSDADSYAEREIGKIEDVDLNSLQWKLFGLSGNTISAKSSNVSKLKVEACKLNKLENMLKNRPIVPDEDQAIDNLNSNQQSITDSDAKITPDSSSKSQSDHNHADSSSKKVLYPPKAQEDGSGMGQDELKFNPNPGEPKSENKTPKILNPSISSESLGAGSSGDNTEDELNEKQDQNPPFSVQTGLGKVLEEDSSLDTKETTSKERKVPMLSKQDASRDLFKNLTVKVPSGDGLKIGGEEFPSKDFADNTINLDSSEPLADKTNKKKPQIDTTALQAMLNRRAEEVKVDITPNTGQDSKADGVVKGDQGGDNAPRNNFNILMGQIKKIKVSEDQTPAAQPDNVENPNHAEVVLANLDEPAGAGQDKQDQAPSAPEEAIKSIVDRLEQTPPASAQAREPRVNSEKAGRKYDTRGGVDSVLSDLASKLSDRIIARSAAVAAGDDLDNKKDSNIWMRGIFGSSVQNPTTGNIGYRGNIAGGSIGTEYETAGGTVFGAVYSNLKGKYIYKDQDRADIRFNIFSIYAEAEIKNFVLLGMASYGHNKVKTRDYINDAQPSEFGSFTSKSYGFDAMVGYKIKKNNIDFLPFVEARYSGSSDSAYTAVKDDGSAGTSYDKTSLSALLVRLGIRASKPIPYCGFMITPYVNLSVERDVNAQKSKVSAYDTDGSRINLSLSERGKEFQRAKFGYNIEGGMALRRGNTEVSASYKGHFRKNYHSHQGSLKLKLFL